jgi:acyl carrier protein
MSQASMLATDADAIAFVMRCIANTPDLYVRKRDSYELTNRLRDDLAVDSIGLVSLFYAVADELGVEGDEAEASNLLTLGDVVALARRLHAGASP